MLLRLLPLGLVASLCLLAAGQVPTTVPPDGLRENTPGLYALTNARIVTAPGATIERGTLLLDDGVIRGVGEVAIPAHARVIDLAGRTIYPGLIDACSELPADASKADPALGELLGAGYWNSLIVPQLRASRLVKPDADLNRTLRSQGVVARLAVPTWGLIRGTGVALSTSDADARRAVLAEAPSLHLLLTVPRERGSGYPNSPMGALALVRQALYDARWYAAAGSADPKRPAIEHNDALAALAEHLRRRTPVFVHCSDEQFVLRAHALASEFDLNLVVVASGDEFRRLDEIAATGRPMIVPLNFPRPPALSTPAAVAATTLETLMQWDLAPENPARLRGRGVRVALTGQGLRSRGELLASVRAAIARGLDPDDALRALTLTPAGLIGIDGELGTIETGKRASFIVVDGPLFEDKTRVLETWVDGRRYEVALPPAVDPRGAWRLLVGEVAGLLTLRGEPGKLTGRLALERPLVAPDESATRPATQPVPEIELQQVRLADRALTFSFKSDRAAGEGAAMVSATIVGDGAEATWSGRLLLPDGRVLALRADPETSEPATRPSTRPTTGTTTRPAPPRALFEPNYPLGAFGRDAAPPQQTVLFRDAAIWTCADAGVIDRGFVLVDGGRIVHVGRDAPASVPEGTMEIDAAGKHLTPGLIDCHSHIATDGGINESGQAITAEVRIGDFINPDDISIYRQLAGGVTAANILHGSANPIGGQNQVLRFRWGEGAEAMKFPGAAPGIKFALGENVKQSNWTERTSTRYPQTRMGVEQIIRDAMLAAKDYQRRRAADPGERVDLELEALAEVLAGRRLIHCHSYRQDEILALLRAAEEVGFRVDVFQHILEGYKVADEMARHGAAGSAFSDWWAYKFEVYDAIPHAGAIMHDAGVVVSFNSDDSELARRLNLEAAKAMKYGGVPPEEALKFVTLNPARQLRIDDRVGSIAVGKDADLVLWSAPPLSVYAVCEQTWIEGRRYFDRAEDLAARDRFRDMKARLVQRALASGQKPAEPGERPPRASEVWPNVDEFCVHSGGER